jgi:hypothetical protein
VTGNGKGIARERAPTGRWLEGRMKRVAIVALAMGFWVAGGVVAADAVQYTAPGKAGVGPGHLGAAARRGEGGGAR